MTDLTVVLPGIMGSVLSRHGRPVWEPGLGMLPRLIRRRAFVESLLRREPEDLTSPFLDDIVPTGLVRDLDVVPGLAVIEGYDVLHRQLSRTVGMVEGDPLDPARRLDGRPGRVRGYPTYYRFAYDWRRDLRACALRLDRLVRQALPPLRERDPDAKVVLVGHSMGGLVARCWMEGTNPATGAPFGGWRDTRALVTLGTPHRGSVMALQGLVEGYRKFCVDFSEALGTFEGAHQLLPRYAALAVPDSAGGLRWVRPHEAEGVGGLDRAAASRAYAVHRDIEEGQARHATEEGYPARAVIPYVGFGHRTQNSAVWDGRTLALSTALPPVVPESAGGGDGTVPWASAIPIELSSEPTVVRHVNEGHGALQSNAHVLGDVLRAVVRTPGLPDVRDVEPAPDALGPPDARPHLRLDLGSTWVRGAELDLLGEPAGRCVVTMRGGETDEITVTTTPLGRQGAPQLARVAPGEPADLPASVGAYRVVASASDRDGRRVSTSSGYAVLEPDC